MTARLLNDGLIEPDPDTPYDEDWRISSAGEAILRGEKEALAKAGREHGGIEAADLLRQLGIRVTPGH